LGAERDCRKPRSTVDKESEIKKKSSDLRERKLILILQNSAGRSPKPRSKSHGGGITRKEGSV